MDKSILIFDDEFTGHHPVYIKYLYEYSINYSNVNFIFVVHKNLEYIFMSKPDNVLVSFLSDIEINSILFSKLNRSLRLTILLNKYIKLYKPSKIFLISLISFLPFGIFLNSKNNISGIIYQIYLYRWRTSNLKTRLFDIVKYLLLTKFKIINNIYILNDDFSVRYFNKIYKSNKFCYLPDPLINIEPDKLTNFKLTDDKFSNKIICLHFGYLESRKGTLEILKSIAQLNKNDDGKYLFVFAGKISEEIRISFYTIYNSIEDKSNIIIHDFHLDNIFLQSLVLSSDLILIPYKNVFQSSGVIGLACQFNKPVVVSKNGLLGKLVKRYKLGYLIEDTSAVCLTEFLLIFNKHKFVHNILYLKNKSSSDFSSMILNKFIYE